MYAEEGVISECGGGWWSTVGFGNSQMFFDHHVTCGQLHTEPWSLSDDVGTGFGHEEREVGCSGLVCVLSELERTTEAQSLHTSPHADG